ARRLPEACGSDSLLRAINGRATIAQMLEAASSPTERAARYRQVYLLMSTMAVRASMEVIPMAARANNASSTTGSQKPVQAEAPLPSPPPTQAPTRAEPQRPSPSMGGGASSPSPSPSPSMHSPPPRTSTTSGVPGTARAPVRPVIDENADRGVMFS